MLKKNQYFSDRSSPIIKNLRVRESGLIRTDIDFLLKQSLLSQISHIFNAIGLDRSEKDLVYFSK
jgi:hypothetical protein